MTYCLGWKTRTCAYLVADTAVTSLRPLAWPRTSFGEQHVYVGDKSTGEAALKIISAGGAGITFSGCARLGYAVAETFRLGITAGIVPREALRRAIDSNIIGSSRVDLTLMCGFVEDGKPCLISYNKNHDGRFVDHGLGELVQLGSLVGKDDIAVCEISDAFVGELTRTKLKGAALLACALGLCQSYGIHNTMLAYGVGGAFTGAFVDELGFHWQPDITYVLYTPGQDTSSSDGGRVFTLIRDGVVVVNSGIMEHSQRVFMNSIGEDLGLLLLRRKYIAQLSRKSDSSLQYDYIVLLNKIRPIIGVVEMACRTEHRDLLLGPWGRPSADGSQRGIVSVSPDLHRLMSGTLVEAQQLDSDDWLVVTLHYRGYKFPHFDIRHKGFEVEFFGECQESVKLPQELIDAYQAARDTAPIFIQARDDVRFGAADMVRFYLQKRGAKLEEFIPEQERRAEGSTFEVIFTIEFAEGAFYMDTQSGRRSIRKLMLRVEISWLPHDESRPTIATLPHLPGPV